MVPASGGKTGEPWRSSELMQVGRGLDYKIQTYTKKYGLVSYDVLYDITADNYNNVLIHGEMSEVDTGAQSASSMGRTVTAEGNTYEFIKPTEGGMQGFIMGDEEFQVNKNSLLASGMGGPSMAWNLYVYHPSLYSFIENNLAANNNWFYLSSTDGYAYQVNVLGKDKDTYVVDIEYPNFEKDRLWINTMYPTPVRVEHYKKTGEVVFSSTLME